MQQYQVILRATNDDGNKSDLELVNVPDFLLDISAIELGDIGRVFGISSQNFSLPGSDINNQFFNNIFDLGTTPAVALNKSVPCQVLVDGEAVFTGKLYIQDVISDDYNNVIYNCVVTNEVVDFKVLTENQGLADLDWAEYDHVYSYASLSQSWNDNLFSGSILYPLINYGSNPTDSSTPGFEFGGDKFQMDNPLTPLKVSQFKPAIQAKTIVDKIFEKIDYEYTSSFIDSEFFQDLYLLNSVDGKDGISFVTPTSGSYVFATATQTVTSGFTQLGYIQLLMNATVYDAGNDFDVSFDTYTARQSGEHIFNINIPFNITSNIGPLQQTLNGRNSIIHFCKGAISVANKFHTVRTPLTNSTSGVISTGNISLNLTQGDVISLFVGLQTPPFNGREQFTTIVSAGQNGVFIKVSTPQNPIGGTVNVNKIFGDIKTLDFMKGLIEKFNLVIEPVANQQNILRIEPFNDWVELGNVVDLTDKLDRSVKYKVEHPVTKLPKKYRFSDALDDDMLNNYQNRTFGNTYGEYNYQTDSDLANGEKQIGGFFAATPVKGLPTKGTNGTVVVPWLVKQEPGKYAQPFNFKPRLLHKTPLKDIPNNEMYGTTTGSLSVPTGSTFYYIDDPATPGIRAINNYVTLLPTTESPTIFSSSLDLHYSNIGYYPFQQSAVDGQCQDGLYNRFWANYINSLYDIDARILTCNILLDPIDIDNIKLNDKFFIDGHLYRINKINGANLVQQKSTEIEFIKILPRRQDFTGRRRISTGLNPEDFEDIITDGFDQGGNVNYVRYDDGVSVTDPRLLESVSVLDGFNSYGQQVAWNTKQPPNFNPSLLILGNSKYNDTQNNVIVVGAGNTIPDNLSNSYLFGTNITIDSSISASSFDSASMFPLTVSPFDRITVMANDATITDSQRIVLIQPDGARIISGSQSNVVINPINDINETDPTGSVYTGNLINQGTADFKSGADLTGSVNITGSFCVNGVCFPFPTGSGGTSSAVLFNHAFALDPTNETFVIIPNAVGDNRAFALEYTLTSGSLAINAGQLQITADGTAAFAEPIIQRNIAGAPTASFTTAYTGPDLDVRATFVGGDYIISGSFIPLADLYSGGTTISGSIIDTGSFATTGSNTFIGNQIITGSLDITGSATLNGTQLQFIGPVNSPYVIPNFTITPTASVTQNIMISQSGIYDINLLNIAAGLSCSINFFYFLDIIPSNSEAQIVISTPSGSGKVLDYRTLVTCSSATEYFIAGFSSTVIPPGSVSATLTRNANHSQRIFVGSANFAYHQVVNSPNGIYLGSDLSGQSVERFYYRFTGSVGTPI